VSAGFNIRPIDRWLEPLLALAVLVALVQALIYTYQFGYLPQPFFYEPSDIWMDWFNTAHWAHEPGAYDAWLTIYPPLSFVFLKFLGIARCYSGAEGLPARECDWLGLVALHSIYVMNIVLTARAFMKIDRRTALPRSFALTAGLPMLYGLERGNLILICFTCVLLAFGPLVRSARLRWIFLGLAINFKVYLIATVFAQLLRRRWLWFEGALIATAGVYLLSFGLFGGGTPGEIYRNIANFSGGFEAVSVLDIWYAGTYLPLTSLLSGVAFPVSTLIGSEVAEWGSLLLPTITRVVQGTIVIAAVATWLRPEVVPIHRLALFGAAMALITAESGGYTQILLILFVFMERWRGVARPWAIFACYLLCIPADIVIGSVPPFVRESYLTGRQVVVTFGIGLGPFIRPALIMSLPFALSCATIWDVWADIRTQGWRTRRRFWRDAPLLPGVARPDPAGK
jgi:hypothetical protein